MKINKRNIIIIGSSVLVASSVGYYIYAKIRNKREINEIHAALDGKVGAYGSIEDFADVFSGETYVNEKKAQHPNLILLKGEYITAYRKALNNAISGFGTDEDAIKGVFRKLKDRVQIAQVADSYQRNYKENLLDALMGDMDPDDQEMKDLKDIMINKLAYRVSK